MNQKLRKNKTIIREFLGRAYIDSDIAAVLDHARAGLFSYTSCCCLAGFPTRQHAPQAIGGFKKEDGEATYHDYYPGIGAVYAAIAYSWLGERDLGHANNGGIDAEDALRRRIIVPMLMAEIRRRRMRLQFAAEVEAVERVGVTQ